MVRSKPFLVKLWALFAAVIVLTAGSHVSAVAQSIPMPLVRSGCRNAEQVRNELKAADQYPLFRSATAVEEPSQVSFTTDKVLETGYYIEYRGEQICVKQRLRAIQVNAESTIAIPDWAAIEGTGKRFNGFLVEEWLRFGGRVIVAATAVDTQDRPIHRLTAIRSQAGQLVIVAGPPDGSYEVLAVRPGVEINRNLATFGAMRSPPLPSYLEQQRGPSKAPTLSIASAERACVLGEFRWCGTLAQLYDGRPPKDKDPGFPRDVARGFELATIGCRGNDATSCLHAALSYHTGQGATRNPALAIQHYRKAIALDPDRDKPLSTISGPARGGLADLGAKP